MYDNIKHYLSYILFKTIISAVISSRQCLFFIYMNIFYVYLFVFH